MANSALTEVKDFVVEFYNAESGNLHSVYTVLGKVAKEVLNDALNQAQEATGEDMSRHRTAIKTADGQGVAVLDNAQSKAQLQAQLAEMQRRLSLLGDDEPEDKGDSFRYPAQPPVRNTDVGARPNDPASPSNSGVQAGTVATPPPAANADKVTQADIDAYLVQHPQR